MGTETRQVKRQIIYPVQGRVVFLYKGKTQRFMSNNLSAPPQQMDKDGTQTMEYYLAIKKIKSCYLQVERIMCSRKKSGERQTWFHSSTAYKANKWMN